MSADWRNKRMAIVKRSKENQPYRVGRIWPWVKTLPDGTKVVKELPPQYRPDELGRFPDFIREVPDHVQRGWLWDEATQNYVPGPPKVIPPKIVPHSDLLEVIAEKIGLDYDELWNEVQARKKARWNKLKGLTPPDEKG